MSLAAHRFGCVEFWILNSCCCFVQAGAVEKIKTIIQNSKPSNQWAVKDINFAKLWLGQIVTIFFQNLRTHIGHNYVKLGCQTKHYEKIHTHRYTKIKMTMQSTIFLTWLGVYGARYD